jgi:hypothetical protein
MGIRPLKVLCHAAFKTSECRIVNGVYDWLELMI